MTEFTEQLQSTLGSSYSIVRELGGGGMSRVFLVRDESLGREIVVKVLSPELAHDLSVERFTREIKVAAALQEPHIVPVLSAGQMVGGLPYYTMPFVRGESLRQRIKEGPLPLAESLTILSDVARALAYAHRQGIVHRDIKPENILLSEGTAVVTDFGIAKALQDARPPASQATLTQTGTSLGSPMYIAPEQAAADPSTDQRADIYAWGVVAYELITGKHPFADKLSLQQMLAAHMSEMPAGIATIAPNLPRSIADLVMRCLSKDPALRPATGSEILSVLNDPSLPARETGDWQRSRRARSAIIATAVILLMIVAGVIWRTRSASAAETPLIAVLPFETEGAGGDSSFADGLGDAVTGKLASLAGLRVIDRKSVLSVAASRGTSAQQTGKSLGAQFVLRASVRWARGADGQPRIRVSPSLVRVSDGTTTWAGEPEIVSPADPFTIQASVAIRVAEALDVAMGTRDRTKLAMRATRDTGAFAAVIRGKHILDENTTASAFEYQKALREFERAYARDPMYADALGLAAMTLGQLAEFAGGKKLLDSSSVIADRALKIDPTQSDAIAAQAFQALATDRNADALSLIQRAIRENPSNVDLLVLEQTVMVMFFGDSAGAWEAVERVVPLAPASKRVLGQSFWTAMALRRFSDAANFLARERAIYSASPRAIFRAAKLAEKLGDSTGIARAVRELGARGGRLGAEDADLMRHGDAALQHELATGSLASFAPGSAGDSIQFYSAKAELFMTRGEYAHARALGDSGWVVAKRLAADANRPPPLHRLDVLGVAWYEALRGNRSAALVAIRLVGGNPITTRYPNSFEAAWATCLKAEVYGLLDDVEAMLPFARRCFTMPNGFPLAYLNESEFARHLNDPRVRAIGMGRMPRTN